MKITIEAEDTTLVDRTDDGIVVSTLDEGDTIKIHTFGQDYAVDGKPYIRASSHTLDPHKKIVISLV